MNPIVWTACAILSSSSIFLFVLGLGGFSRRPFLFSTRWMYAWAGLHFAPLIIIEIFSPNASNLHDSLNAVIMVNCLSLTVLSLKATPGYCAFGATADLFRGTFLYALRTLGLAYEEHISTKGFFTKRYSTVRIPSEKIDIQVVAPSWMGMAEIRTKQVSGKARTKEIATLMNQYFASDIVEAKRVTSFPCVALGAFLLLPFCFLLFLSTRKPLMPSSWQAVAAVIVSDTNVAISAHGIVEHACSEESILRSTESATRVSVGFKNDTSDVMSLIWLDYSGKRVSSGTLSKGERAKQSTFVTHPWIIGDISGRCRTIVVPTTPGGAPAPIP